MAKPKFAALLTAVLLGACADHRLDANAIQAWQSYAKENEKQFRLIGSKALINRLAWADAKNVRLMPNNTSESVTTSAWEAAESLSERFAIRQLLLDLKVKSLCAYVGRVKLILEAYGAVGAGSVLGVLIEDGAKPSICDSKVI